jgi:xanthine/CO dehydrogenase XdhC/CoxF family maturation factor
LALRVIDGGRPILRHYETGGEGDELWGLGLGCQGSVDIFINKVTTEVILRVVDRLRHRLTRQGVLALATILEGEAEGGMLIVSQGDAVEGTTGDDELDGAIASHAKRSIEAGASSRVEIGASKVFIEVLNPPPQLLVVGAGDDAIPLVAFAGEIGFRVSIVDHRESLLTAERFPTAIERTCTNHEGQTEPFRYAPSYAVVMTHSLAHDRGWLERLLATDVRYIGVLGPRARTREMLDALRAGADPRIFGPVGLDVGADGPEQVALSVVAEILACHRRRSAGHLRERTGPIHTPSEREITEKV